jgi:hypothetical protein
VGALLRGGVDVLRGGVAAVPGGREDADERHVRVPRLHRQVVGSVQLDLVLTQDLIQRFLIDSEGKVGAGTRRNRRGHLRRALKAAAGDAPRVTHSPRSAGAEPYAAAELDKLAAAAFSRATLAAALACGLELGLRPRARPSVVSPATAVPPSIRQP